MFGSLSDAFGSILHGLFRGGAISTNDITRATELIKEALIDADVALPVIDRVVEQIVKKCLGDKVLKSVSPRDMIIKASYDALLEIFGGKDNPAASGNLSLGKVPAVVMMVGLQGSGKTTSAVKLANYLAKKKNKRILVASLDVYRPAAQQQLEVMAKRSNIASLEIVDDNTPLEITARALKAAFSYDVLILDTAGRLHIDEALISELKKVKKLAQPSETLLVADSMTGQEAINIASAFQEEVGITGTIMTRVDGDARGGAIISMMYVAKCPVRFVGTGEGVEDLEYFYPDRAVNKILGMGDVVSAVEKAREQIEEAEATKMLQRIRKGIFDFEDMLRYYNIMNKMGGLKSVLQYLPSMGDIKGRLGNVDEGLIKKNKAIIQSMTKAERKFATLLNIMSRKQRIAKGSGTKMHDINMLVRQQQQMQKMFAKLKNLDLETLSQNEEMLKKFNINDLMSMIKR